MSTYTSKTEDVIRDEVFKKAQEMDIPIIKEQIKVVRNGRSRHGLRKAAYTVHVNLPGYPLDPNFNVSARNTGCSFRQPVSRVLDSPSASPPSVIPSMSPARAKRDGGRGRNLLRRDEQEAADSSPLKRFGMTMW